jgi:hypothetical protein
MLKHRGEEKAGKGTYWNFSTGERIRLTGDGVLPGPATTTYYRLSPLTILLLGPIFGLAYFVFMPFIGIVVITKIVGQEVLNGAVRVVGDTISMGWRPNEAYLEGKKEKGEEGKK